ncbi:MAG: GCN5-related N-acetyltransferase [Anaerocolumna sp.]|jgi:predicted GNAT family N-acyltransferase|nr:GCN5-related N-acetyltransferase [Anaerocolumna sp.]
MVQGKYLYYGDDLSDCIKIRKQVFVIEQNISEEEEFDDIDNYAIHGLVFDNDNKKAVATGRVFHDGTNYRIGRVAVLKSERGKSYGDFVVRMLANKAFLMGASEIHIDAQVTAVSFYEKIGFMSYGEEFLDAGIKHIGMKLNAGNICKLCDNITN